MKTILILFLLITLPIFSQQVKDSKLHVNMKKEALLPPMDRKEDSLKHPENDKQKMSLSNAKNTFHSETKEAPMPYPAKEKVSGKKDDGF